MTKLDWMREGKNNPPREPKWWWKKNKKQNIHMHSKQPADKLFNSQKLSNMI